MIASGLERVFEIGPAYRAEKHDTPRHINEFESLDVEMAFIESEQDLMDLETRILAAIFEASAEPTSAIWTPGRRRCRTRACARGSPGSPTTRPRRSSPRRRARRSTRSVRRASEPCAIGRRRRQASRQRSSTPIPASPGPSIRYPAENNKTRVLRSSVPRPGGHLGEHADQPATTCLWRT